MARHVKSRLQNLDDLLSPASLITTTSILPPFRAWAKLLASGPEYVTNTAQSIKMGPSRRQIWQSYYTSLSVLLRYRASYESKRRKKPIKSAVADFNNRFLFESKLAQSAELKRVENAYENLLLSEVGFPKASEANVEVEDWTDQVTANWCLLTGSEWDEEDLEQGGKAAVSRRILAVSPATSSTQRDFTLEEILTISTRSCTLLLLEAFTRPEY